MTPPTYIVNSNDYDLCLRGPYRQEGVTLRAYVFDADRDKLQKTCNRYLNDVLGDKVYKPIAGTVLLTMLNMETVTATPEDLGYMHEIDGAFQFPVVRLKDLEARKGLGFAAFMPYLWVNSDWPLVTGRESFGFRKGLGTSFSDGDDDQVTHAAQLTHIEGWVTPAKKSQLIKARIVDIHHDEKTPSKSWASLAAAVKDIGAELLKGFPFEEMGQDGFERASSGLLGPDGVKLPVAFLKQHRDAFHPGLACHQRVFEANGFIPFKSFRGGGILPGNHSVTLHDHDSHPIRTELGLPNGPLKPRFAFELSFDFDMLLP